MRVMFTTRGSSGHVGPLVPFARACVAAGHDVVVAAQRQFGGNVERAGLAFAPFDDPPREDWMPLFEGFRALDLAAGNEVMIRDFFGEIDVRAALPGLRELVAGFRPDVLVRESWEFASTLVGDLNDIPVVRVGLSLGAVEEYTVKLAAPSIDAARSKLGLAPDPAGERLRDTPYFTVVPDALEDPAVEMPQSPRRFRAPVPAEAQPLPDWWPGSDDPLVYMTFGSVAAAPHLPYYPEVYRRAIDALAGLPVRLLVTVGDPARDIAELGELPPNVRAQTWVPHHDVAAQAELVISHGGFGSTIDTLAHAVPMVVLPLFSADQWANGEAVHRSGAGICLDRDGQSRNVVSLPDPGVYGELADAVPAVLDGAAFRRKAARVAEAMAWLPPVGDWVQDLEAIAR